MIVFALLIGRVPMLAIVITCFLALLFNIFLLPYITNRKLEREIDTTIGFSPGLLLYPGVLGALSIVFFKQAIFLAIAWGIMAFGDGFANLGGRYWGKHALAWNKKKTWEGSLVFIVIGTCLTLLLISILPESLKLDTSWSTWVWIVCGSTIFASIWESIPGTIDDNLIVPISGGFSAFYLYQAYQYGDLDLPNEVLIYFMVALFLTLLSLLTKKITIAGAIIGGIITFLLMMAFNWTGLLMIFSFFVLGTAVSIWKKDEKRNLKLEEENRGKRGYYNVLANAGVAALTSVLAITFSKNVPLYQLMMTAGFASALSDTVSSELGNVYGRKFINILTLRKGKRGEDGVISLEGSIGGMLASLGIGLLYFMFYSDLKVLWIIFFAGIIGNITDSILGASLQKRGFMNNHTVNFFSIFTAALFALAMFYLFTK